MKIVIVSDIHANLAALEALPERNFDQLWCIGDLVDYGPRPHEVVQWVKRNADLAVRGNHDHAAGFSVDPQCSLPFKRLAAETLSYTLDVCTKEDLELDRWLEEVTRIDANVLIVGHTHTPFVRKVGNTTIVNPGSLGQPKTGRPLACYAVWEDGLISLREYAYPINDTIQHIRAMPISADDQEALIAVLESGDMTVQDRTQAPVDSGVVFRIKM